MNRPGCITHSQILAIKTALDDMATDPSMLSDLEGCGTVAEFERRFAEACGVEYAVAVSSGTAAIHAALLALEIGPGDEVISSPYSWSQTVSPVLFAGATVVFADIDPFTWHLDLESVAERISPRTKAIIVPHLFGHKADMPGLMLLAKIASVAVISDAAHAMGARLYGKPAGAWGDIVCFSLGRGKLVSAGEGGALVTNDYDLYKRAIALTQHPERYWRLTGEPGSGLVLNYRLHPLQAVLALADLKGMRVKLSHRLAVKEAFLDGLDNSPGIWNQEPIPGESQAAYGIALSITDGMDGGTLCVKAQGKGIPLRRGPVGVPLNLAVAKCRYPKMVRHWTHEAGSCPVAEEHCRKHELWALSSLDMDGMKLVEAFEMGQNLKYVCGLVAKAA